MRTSRQNYARLAVSVSILTAFASIIYAILIQKFDLYLQIGIGLVIIGLAVFALLDPQAVREFLTGRQAKNTSAMALVTLGSLALLVILNLLANKFGGKWDLTEDRTNTLTNQTVQIIQNIPGQAELIGFYSKNYPSDNARTLLAMLAEKSKGKINYRFVDLEADPVTAKSYEVTRDATVLVLLNGRQEQVTLVNENEIVSALLRLSNPNKPVVYFLTGHGEISIDSSGGMSFSKAKSTLEKKNYEVRSLNLLANPEIPKDATLLVIAGPTKPVSTKEVELIADYLKAGKRLLVMEDPLILTSFDDEPDPLAEYLDSQWGIRLNRDLVVDTASNPATQPVASQYGQHPITQRLDGIVTVFPASRSVNASASAPSGVSLVELVKTSNNSWGETDLTSLQNNRVEYNEGADTLGPVSLAVAASDSTTKARVVVFGSSFFAEDQNYSTYANGDLFINAIDWAAENDQLINLTPRSVTQRVLLPPSPVYLNLVFLVVVILIPGAIVGAGIATYLHRRRLG